PGRGPGEAPDAPGTSADRHRPRSRGAAHAQGVHAVAVPVPDEHLVVGAAVAEVDLRRPAGQVVGDVEPCAAAHGDGVVTVAVPVTDVDLVGEAPEVEGVVGGTAGPAVGEEEAVLLLVVCHCRPEEGGGGKDGEGGRGGREGRTVTHRLLLETDVGQ